MKIESNKFRVREGKTVKLKKWSAGAGAALDGFDLELCPGLVFRRRPGETGSKSNF